jgi:hypothetical protein
MGADDYLVNSCPSEHMIYNAHPQSDIVLSLVQFCHRDKENDFEDIDIDHFSYHR